MHRLFSTFARGRPGAGLLLLRLVAGVTLIVHPVEPVVPHAFAIVFGLFLLAGLWTPIIGALLTPMELWLVVSQPGDPWTPILLASIGAMLALVGPGAWSVDSRLFGWKRIG